MYEIIDVHTHVFPDKVAVRAADNTANYYSLPRQGDGTVEKLIAGAEGLGNVRFVVSSAALRASAEYSLEHQFARFKPFILTAKCAN